MTEPDGGPAPWVSAALAAADKADKAKAAKARAAAKAKAKREAAKADKLDDAPAAKPAKRRRALEDIGKTLDDAILDTAVRMMDGKPLDSGPPALRLEPVEYDDDTGLPVGCPVQPLGIDRNVIYVLTAGRQVMALNGRDRSRNTIPALFAPQVRLPMKWWPRVKRILIEDAMGEKREEHIITGIKPEDLFDDLVAACARKGIWDPANTERSTGAWTLANGELLFHVGNALLTKSKELPLGLLGGHVYSGAKAIQRPWPKPVSTAAGLELLSHFETWAWTRGSPGDPIDALLLLGWHAAGRLGAALKWRPMCFVIGGAGTGKSTLHGVLKMLHADDGIIYTTDTSAAALANLIGHSSRPVVVDELENSAGNNQRARQVVELARLAASGAPRHRSDPNQGVSVSVARNAMLFDAILPPEMSAADRSRFAMLRLGRLPDDAIEPPKDPVYWDELGRKIMRRVMEQWDRFERTLSAFEAALRKSGHQARSANQFGVLLASAHLLLSDTEPADHELARWAERLAPATLIDLSDGGDDAVNCINHLAVSMPAERYKGTIRSTSECVADIMRDADREACDRAHGLLALSGMRMYREKETHADGRPMWLLGISNAHPGLTHIFQNTPWQTSPAVTPGAWVESLRRLDGAQNVNRRINGRATRQVAIPARQHVVDPWPGAADAEADR